MVGRGKLYLNEEQLHKLAALGCTMPEIAIVMDCSEDTLQRNYAGIIARGREEVKMSIRRAQIKKALEGNSNMLIWLGKHLLGQKDSIDLTANNETEVRRILSRWSNDTNTHVKMQEKEEAAA